MFVQINIFENSESGEMNENLFNFIYVFEYYYFFNIIHRWILDLALVERKCKILKNFDCLRRFKIFGNNLNSFRIYLKNNEEPLILLRSGLLFGEPCTCLQFFFTIVLRPICHWYFSHPLDQGRMNWDAERITRKEFYTKEK